MDKLLAKYVLDASTRSASLTDSSWKRTAVISPFYGTLNVLDSCKLDYLTDFVGRCGKPYLAPYFCASPTPDTMLGYWRRTRDGQVPARRILRRISTGVCPSTLVTSLKKESAPSGAYCRLILSRIPNLVIVRSVARSQSYPDPDWVTIGNEYLGCSHSYVSVQVFQVFHQSELL